MTNVIQNVQRGELNKVHLVFRSVSVTIAAVIPVSSSTVVWSRSANQRPQTSLYSRIKQIVFYYFHFHRHSRSIFMDKLFQLFGLVGDKNQISINHVYVQSMNHDMFILKQRIVNLNKTYIKLCQKANKYKMAKFSVYKNNVVLS